MIEYFQALIDKPIPDDAVRAVLGSIGFVNSIVTFVIANVMQRPSMTHWRSRCWWTLLALWLPIVPCLLEMLTPGPILGVPSGMLKLALVMWLGGFASLLALFHRIFFLHPSALATMRHTSNLEPFERPRDSEFGVAFMDRAFIDLQQQGRKLRFPILLVADRDAPGLEFAMRFLIAGLTRGEGAVYLSFTRPASVISGQVTRRMKSQADEILSRQLIIIDCYSPLYRREKRSTAAQSQDQLPSPIVMCDPRDPVEVQNAYKGALRHLRDLGLSRVRSVYESLSDFLSIADPELVISYLRHMIVLEEEKRVQALYLLWPEVLQEPVSDRYLAWFSNALIRLQHSEDGFTASLENVGPGSFDYSLDEDLDLADRGFEIDRCCCSALATATAALSYEPIPFDDDTLFPPSDDAFIASNFFFFLTAIDHRTHPRGAAYEFNTGDRVYSGSDLMYLMARSAQLRDMDRFTADNLREITETQVAELFRSPAGVGISDPGLRAFLLRDAATRLIDSYDGDIQSLLTASGPYLDRSHGDGILKRLSEFRAFEDPIQKKSMLLLKLLRRQGLAEIVDLNHLCVAVDKVVIWLALRSGLVRARDPQLIEKLQNGERLKAEETLRLRRVTRQAFQMVSKSAQKPADQLDDLLWGLGREILRLQPNNPLDPLASGELGKRVEDRHALLTFLNIVAGRSTYAPRESAGFRPPILPETWYY